MKSIVYYTVFFLICIASYTLAWEWDWTVQDYDIDQYITYNESDFINSSGGQFTELLSENRTGGDISYSGKLSVDGNTDDNSATFGSFGLQSYAVNNAWLTDNMYYDGSNFIHRATGKVAMLRFISGIQFEGGASKTAGSTASLKTKMYVAVDDTYKGVNIADIGAGAPAGTYNLLEVGSSSTVINLASTILNPISASGIPLVVQGKASQTANLTEWQDSSGTVLASVDKGGNFTLTRLIGSGDNIVVGDAGADSHSLTADDDLFVSGKLEVDSSAYFDSDVTFADYGWLTTNRSSTVSFGGDLDVSSFGSKIEMENGSLQDITNITFDNSDAGLSFYSGTNELLNIKRFSGANPDRTVMDFPGPATYFRTGGVATWTFSGAGNINIQGASTIVSAGYLKLYDDIRLILGTGNDAIIKYNTSDLFIDPDAVGSGSVWIGATGDDDIHFRNAHAIGNITGNQIYGEMYCFDGGDVIDLTTQNIWENFINLSTGDLNGFTFSNSTPNDNSTLTALVAGRYKIDYSVSFSADRADNFEVAVAVNNVIQEDTASHRKISNVNDVGNTGGTGIITVAVNDDITLMVKDEDNPVGDVTLDHVNFVIKRVGT